MSRSHLIFQNSISRSNPKLGNFMLKVLEQWTDYLESTLNLFFMIKTRVMFHSILRTLSVLGTVFRLLQITLMCLVSSMQRIHCITWYMPFLIAYWEQIPVWLSRVSLFIEMYVRDSLLGWGDKFVNLTSLGFKNSTLTNTLIPRASTQKRRSKYINKLYLKLSQVLEVTL